METLVPELNSMDCDDHQADQNDVAFMDITPIKQQIASLPPSFDLNQANNEQPSPQLWKQPVTAFPSQSLLSKEDENDIHILSLSTPKPADQQSSQGPHPSEPTSSGSSSDTVDQLKQRLAWTEASRDELARQQGTYKGTIAKLEGAVASGERRLQQQAAEIEALKAKQRQLQSELSAAKIQANVTPERCRSSLRSLLDESLKAQASAQVNEVAVRKLREMCDYEAREQEALHEFLQIEHQSLVDQCQKLSNELQSARNQSLTQQIALEASENKCKRAEEQSLALTAEVESLRAELYFSKEKEVELSAEVTFLAQEAAGTKAALGAIQSECEQVRSELTKARSDVEESKEVGSKIYKQMRAALRALDKHHGTLSKVAPDCLVLIKSLSDWMSSQS